MPTTTTTATEHTEQHPNLLASPSANLNAFKHFEDTSKPSSWPIFLSEWEKKYLY